MIVFVLLFITMPAYHKFASFFCLHLKLNINPLTCHVYLQVYVYMFYKAAVATSPVMSFDFRGP